MLPQDLMANALFCCWKREERGGNMTKIPYDPKTGERAKSNDPSTFSDYEEAVWKSHAFNCNGIGIYVGNGFSAIDIDHCIENGLLSDLAETIVNTMDSYTELSPSGTGLRILFKIPPGFVYDKEKYYIKNPTNGVEIYVEGATSRFVTVTGNRLEGTPEDTYDRAEELQQILETYMRRPARKRKKSAPMPARKFTLTDDQIIEKASKEERFDALFHEGDMTYYNNDQSSADLALCNKLAFWCACDKPQMDRIFRRSALMRPKWDSPRDSSTYGDITLQRAIDDCDSVYEPVSYERNVFDRLVVPALNVGKWSVHNGGIFYERVINKRTGESEEVRATSTVLAPAMYIENLDTNTHKTEIHFLHNGSQRSIIVDNETISNRNKIIVLANHGVDVTTSTSTALVDYLSDMRQLNADTIPFCSAVSRLGWVGNKFVPYDTSVKFDGELSDRKLYRAISKAGTLEEWRDYMRPLRENLPLRLMMAASFASPLIERVGALPFIFHLWGKTGSGKTVALRVAMSIWGNPRLGELLYTMNMTDNAMMNTAGFLYSIPFAGDELQLVKCNTGYDRLIMRVTEGIDRGRMKFDAKIAQKTWRNAFLFTGEEPCTSDSSGGGAKNRVIEVNVDGRTIIEDGHAVAGFVDTHYGCAGEAFIEYAKTADLSTIYDSYFHTMTSTVDTTDKQAMAAAMLLLGDYIACQSIFVGDEPLTVDDLEEFVKNDSEVSTAVRAEEYVRNWISQNQNRFYDTGNGEVYGVMEGDQVYVISSVLKDALQGAGFDFDAVKRDWEQSGFLIKYDKYTMKKRIGKMIPRVVHFDCTT